MTHRTRIFTLETLIMVDKKVLFSPGNIPDVLGLIDWVSGESNCTHQIPRAMEQMGPFLRKQSGLSFLADIPDPDHVKSGRDWHSYINEQIGRFGSSHDVPQMPKSGPDAYDSFDPLHAAQEMAMRELEAQQKNQKKEPGSITMPDGSAIQVDGELSRLLHGHVTIADFMDGGH